MRAPIYDRPVATLVISPVVGQAGRANELRLHGHPAWVAASDADLTWLYDHAHVRPSYSLIDLAAWVADDRPLASLVAVAALARRARLPLVLVGAKAYEVQVFEGVVACLPSGSGVQEIVGAMRRVAA